MAYLTKSDYTLGLHCIRQLWCKKNKPELLPEHSARTKTNFDTGNAIGALAKQLYPSGIEIDRDNATTKTKELVLKKVPLFEASFSAGTGYCKVDILVPTDNEWNLIEVKASSSVKEEHLYDVAFQRLILEKSGIAIKKTYVMHVNTEYVFNGTLDVQTFFTQEDVTDKVLALLPCVDEKIQQFLHMLSLPMPTVQYGVNCKHPKECPVCSVDIADASVIELYHGGAKMWELLNAGVRDILALPSTYKVTEKQEIQVLVAKTAELHIEKEKIQGFLEKLDYPLYMLDFETIAPAIPLFIDTRPYQKIPFQFSLHVIEKETEVLPWNPTDFSPIRSETQNVSGVPKVRFRGHAGEKSQNQRGTSSKLPQHSTSEVNHYEFLARDKKDPRQALLEALKVISEKGTILTYYAPFERSVFHELAENFPEEKEWILKIIARIDDLHVPFKEFWYYNPLQHGSCSIKEVLPAITGAGYEGMEINNGELASNEFMRVMYGDVTVEEKEKVLSALLIYCKKDTEAMIEVLRELERAGR